MTEQEAQMLLAKGTAIDTNEAAFTDAAAAGLLDDKGGIVAAPAPDPDAGAMEWLIVPEIIAWGITAVFPETQENYTAAAKMDLARKIAPVAEKYGWDGPGNAPELALAVGAIGFSMPAVLAYRARKEKALEGPENGSAEGAQSGSGQ
jgi:hypothetical protein